MSDLNNLFHPFVQTHFKDHWLDFTSPRMEFYNNNNIIPDVSFGAGFLVAKKVCTMDIPHIHDGAFNFFVFTGADLSNFFDSEFEVDYCIGDSAESMEIYNITKPSIACAPPGVIHTPIYYKTVVGGVNTMMEYVGHAVGRVFSRNYEDGNEVLVYSKEGKKCVEDPSIRCYGCGKCFSDPESTPEKVAEYMETFYKNKSAAGKYKDCVVELRKDYHTLGDAVMNPRCVFKGKEDMPNTVQQFSYNIITAPCKLGDDEPISNGTIAEFLWFSGTDVVDPWNAFDAEIEVMLGEDPDSMQAVTFDKPGVIAIPPGTWRGAVTVKRLGKPVCFIPYYPSEKPRYKLTQKIVDGKKLLVYDDETTITNPTAGDELYFQIKR